jgi:hypothetical protein
MIQKAANRIIELHDDNPIYLQIIVKFCYTLEQDAPPRINLDFHNEIFENKVCMSALLWPFQIRAGIYTRSKFTRNWRYLITSIELLGTAR